MLLQRIGIDHLRIWILLLLLSLVPAALVNRSRRTSEDLSIYTTDYGDQEEAENAFRNFEALCAARSRSPTSEPSIIDALCSSALKKE